MKLIISSLSLFCLLSGCNTVSQISPQPKDNVANCPQPATELPKIEIQKAEQVYTVFDYQIRNIVAETDTISFQSSNYNFIFCRGNSSWTIQPASLAKQGNEVPQNEEEYQKRLTELGDPPYQTIELNQQSYQYRVVLNPNPFPDFQVEPQEVIFELVLPDSKQPQSQVLYTLVQTKQAQTGIQLGVPSISSPFIWDNRLFWSISPEQGEGNGGIATIASYDPQTEKITLIQPQEIAGQQINDFVVAGESGNPNFWLATQISGEGNPYLPGMGLVNYSPRREDFTNGSITAYHVRNSSIIGAIPTKLKLEAEKLWLGTGNGICQLEWQTIDDNGSWSCWRFALMAKLPSEALPVYSSLLANNTDHSLKSAQDTIEVLWWLPQNPRDSNSQGRYEVRYDSGFTKTLSDREIIPWTEYYDSSFTLPNWLAPVHWVGDDWHWNGNIFVRGFDQVPLNFFGGGFTGIGTEEYNQYNMRDMNAIRGDLELIALSQDTIEVKYYSGWVNDRLLEPYLTIIPQRKLPKKQENPLLQLSRTK